MKTNGGAHLRWKRVPGVVLSVCGETVVIAADRQWRLRLQSSGLAIRLLECLESGAGLAALRMTFGAAVVDEALSVLARCGAIGLAYLEATSAELNPPKVAPTR